MSEEGVAAVAEAGTTAEASTVAGSVAEPSSSQDGAAAEPTADDAAAKEPEVVAAAEPSRMDRIKASLERQKQGWREKQAAANAHRMATEARAETERLRAELEETRGRADRAEKDPLAYLKERGVSADKLARKAIEDGSPEAQLAALKAEIQELRGTMSQREEERVAAEESRAKAAASARAEAAFIEQASNLDTYPTLARLAAADPEMIVGEAYRTLKLAQQRTGMVYTDQEVLEFLEDKYSTALSGSPTRNGANGTTSNARNGKETQNGTGAKGKQNAGIPRTLSGKDAAQTGSLPANYDDMTDAEQKRHLADLYRRTAKLTSPG